MNRILSISLFLLLTHFLSAQGNLSKILQDKYYSLDENHSPGFYIGIIKTGIPIYGKAFGMANLEHKIPFSASTVSDLGSVGKQLTVLGILILQEEGKLKIDDEINEHLPELPQLNESVNIKHLIQHTSGIPDVYALHALRGFRHGDHISQSDAYHFLKARPQVDFEPGSRYRYSNTGYMLLAEIIREASGMEFEAFMQDRIFKPLGMHHTYIMDIPGEIYPEMADSYILSPENKYVKLYDNSTLQGGGGVYASGHDVLKWIDNFRTRKIGDESSFEFMLTNAILNDGSELPYAGGINVDSYRNLTRYHHNGSSAAARTRMVYYPDYELGFIIKSNTTSVGYKDFSIMEDIIIDQYLSDSAAPKSTPEDKSSASQSEDVSFNDESYNGKYYNEDLDLTLTVDNVENGLVLSNFYYPFPTMKYHGNQEFGNDGNKLKFKRDDKGDNHSFTLTTPRASGLVFKKKSSR
jgi:CubicO group peptidase (beta-lactamase class C family)